MHRQTPLPHSLLPGAWQQLSPERFPTQMFPFPDAERRVPSAAVMPADSKRCTRARAPLEDVRATPKLCPPLPQTLRGLSPSRGFPPPPPPATLPRPPLCYPSLLCRGWTASAGIESPPSPARSLSLSPGSQCAVPGGRTSVRSLYLSRRCTRPFSLKASPSTSNRGGEGWVRLFLGRRPELFSLNPAC